ncbi:MAG: hypothetical protein MRY83_10110 [Flavobacteriales bacterium]|nr:hypothetical protein [Flavobacteriales bacterium]
MSQYPSEILKITLTPMSRFFFGGEIVFGRSGAQDKRRRSYLVHSNIFPQQTSILGMIREQLLRQNNLLSPWDSKEKKERAKRLIGNTGFGIKLTSPGHRALKTSESFGFIKELSPLLLEDHNGNLLQPVPLDDGTGKEGESLRWSKKNGFLTLVNLDTKRGLPLHFAPPSGSSISASSFFEKQQQVGITVTNRNKWREDRANDKEAFFRQSFFKNRNSELATLNGKGQSEYAFTFWIRVSTGFKQHGYLELSDAHVKLGGEGSTFSMKVEKADYADRLDNFLFPVAYRKNVTPPEGYRRLLLLNDTYIPAHILKENDVFPVANTASFRFFSTTLEGTTNFHLLSKEESTAKWKKTGKKQSKKYTLLSRGGVLLIPEDKADLVKKEITEQTAFRQIGYNYIQ